MFPREKLLAQLPHTLTSVNLSSLGTKYSGKVRDCYTRGNQRILIASDRLSAFDRVLTTIPFKGQLINDLAGFWFEKTKNIVPNHVISQPHPNVFVAHEVQILPIEVIIRGYLTGSAWRDYQAGKGVSGIQLPKGMKKSQRFDTPLITPSTKAEAGAHDEPISSEEIVSQGIVEKKLWDQVCETALKLFDFGSKTVAANGLLLVDTKYEFGLLTRNGKKELVLADEVHTQDSSRYWLSNSYQSRYEAGEDPEMLDKEFVRRWLMEQGYMGEGIPPVFTDEFRVDTAQKYIGAFEQITGQTFDGQVGPVEEKIKDVLKEL